MNVGSPTPAAGGMPRGHEHREVITRAMVGAYAGLERGADPDLPEAEVARRAMRRAMHAYDRLAGARVGQLLPNRFGKAVPIIAPDERTGA